MQAAWSSSHAPVYSTRGDALAFHAIGLKGKGLMRLRFALPSLMLVCAGAGAVAQTAPVAPSCADLHLVPAVRECSAVATMHLYLNGVVVSSGDNAENKLTASDLIRALGIIPVNPSIPGDYQSISLLRKDTDLARRLLARYRLRFDKEMQDEGYVIVPLENSDLDSAYHHGTAVGLAVIAETSAGLFYGAQTVKQLVRGSGKDTTLLIPTIRDWPAMAHRGLSDDWSRGPLPTMDFLKREIRTLAAYKYNIFSPYFEHTFAYASSPVAAFPGGAMTPDEARELVAYADKYHITILP